MSIFMRKKPKAAIALLCLLAVFTWLTLSPMSEAQAVAVVDDVVIWGIVAALASMGVTFAAEQAAQSDIVGGIRDLLEDAGVDPATLDRVQLSVTAPGILKLAPAVYNAAAAIRRWLGNNSTDNVYPVVSSGASLNGFSLYSVPVTVPYIGNLWVGNNYISTGVSYYQFSCPSFSSPVYAYFAVGSRDTQYRLRLISESPFTCVVNLYAYPDELANWSTNGESLSVTNYSGVYVCNLSSRYFNGSDMSLSSSPVSVPLSPYVSDSVLASDFASSFSSSDSSLDAAINPTVAAPVDVAADRYVTAPGLTYGSAEAMTESWYDYVTAAPGTVTYPITKAVATQIDAAAIQSGAGTAEDIDPDLDPVIGLVDVFPFCIPFDIYNFLALFNHTREAPSVTIPLALPEYIGGTQEITIDLSSWDSVARILRTVELIAFIVGLAFETRKFIKW